MKKASQYFRLCFITVLMSSILMMSQSLVYAESTAVIASLRTNVVNCPSPPANFNPLYASGAEISYYGLPPRPQGHTSKLAAWLRLVTGAKHRSCTFINSHRYSQPLNIRSLVTKRSLVTDPYSTNYTSNSHWSGYFSGSGLGNGFKQVDGYWNVPCWGPYTPSNSRATTWLGLGGWYPNYNLWQAGTTEDPSTGYHLWWEAFPNNYEQINISNLSCGDQIYAYADWNVDYSNRAHIYIQDENPNNGTYISTTYYSGWEPNLQSADWIDERPGCSLTSSNSHYLLSDFRYVQWSGAETVPNYSGAGWGSINGFVNYQVTMYETNDGQANITDPYSLTNGGYNFQDNWLATGGDDTC